ncbi:MAG: alpha/beta fold hydrolase [bacterium]|nr:alpha/beta fold hydrolase [bacterium]
MKLSRASAFLRSNRKRLIALTTAFVVLAFVALNVLAYNHAGAMMRYTDVSARTLGPESLGTWEKLKVLLNGVNLPRPVSQLEPTAMGPETRELSIAIDTGRDPLTLCAWYNDLGEETPLVIIFHGYSTEKTTLLREAKGMLELGASVLLVDFRGSGGSSESYCTVGVHEARDVAAMVRYARQQLEHSSIVLFGQSMGAVAIMRAVHKLDVQPDSIILESVFDSMLNTVRNRFDSMGVPSFPSAELLVFWGGQQLDFDGFEHDPIQYAASLTCRTLVRHGSEDPRAKISEARSVFDAVPGPKTFHEFRDLGHESFLGRRPEEWKAVVSKFLN